MSHWNFKSRGPLTDSAPPARGESARGGVEVNAPPPALAVVLPDPARDAWLAGYEWVEFVQRRFIRGL